MFPLQTIAKALISTAVGAGAVYVGSMYHIPVPMDMQDTVTNIALAVIGGLVTGAATYTVPNMSPQEQGKIEKKQKRQARKAAK